jgi:hypothetical protein
MLTPIARRELADGRALEVWPLTFGRARLLLVRTIAGDAFPDVLDGW